MESLALKYVPMNASKSTKWALSNFNDWKRCRKERFPDDQRKHVPETILSNGNESDLCKWLGLYVAETRRKDGSDYPPRTLYVLLTGLLRRMRSFNPSCSNFLDTNNSDFSTLHACMDNVFRRLRSTGVGSTSKKTEAFSKDEDGETVG